MPTRSILASNRSKRADRRCSTSRTSVFAAASALAVATPQRAHFNEVNSKSVYDALSDTLISPTQKKRFDRTVDRAAHRIPVAIRPLLLPRSSVD